MRVGATMIGCGLAMCVGVAIVAAAQSAAVQAPAAPKSFERQWSQEIDAPGQLAISAGAQRVFVTDNKVGIDARAVADGAIAWSGNLPSDLPAAVAGDQVYVASGGRLHALAEATGTERWARDLDSPAVALLPHGTSAVVASGKAIRAFSAAGAVTWEYALPADAGRDLLAIGDNLVYVGLTDRTILGVDAATGALKWRKRLGAVPRALTAGPGRVYFGGGDGHLHAYDRNGGHVWTFKRANVIGAPAVDEDQVYAALWDNTVMAYDAGNGHQRWRRTVTDRAARGPLLSGPFVVTPLTSDAVAAMPKTADKTPPPAAAPSSSARSRNRLYVATISVDGSQIFAVIQLENRSRRIVAFKRE